MAAVYRRHWPLITAVVVFAAATAYLVSVSLSKTQGHLSYCLDDTYIHMAIAKHFVRNGVWGVTPYEFNSASSSILWTLLISAAFFLFGVRDAAPLVLTIISGILVLGAVHVILERSRVSKPFTLIALLAVIFAVPLPAMTLVGLEHVMHAFLTLVFVWLAAVELSRPKGRAPVSVIAIAPLLSAARYEGLFTVFVVCVLFAIRRRWKYAFAIGLASLVPMAVYGLISISHGRYFLPNSVLLKATPQFGASRSVTDYVLRCKEKLLTVPLLYWLPAAAVCLSVFRSWRRWTKWQPMDTFLIVFLGTLVFHLLLARVHWFYRYEVYLIVFGIAAVALQLFTPVQHQEDSHPFVKYRIAKVLIIFLLIPVQYRCQQVMVDSPRAVMNIYQQQYQMGLFLRSYYQGQSIAANDVGAINYLADLRCLDLLGLSSIDVARARMNHTFSRDFGRILSSHRPRMAVVYFPLFREVLPPNWTMVGQWAIRKKVSAAFETVSFYSTDNAEEKSRLAAALRQFSSRLPRGVKHWTIDPDQ